MLTIREVNAPYLTNDLPQDNEAIIIRENGEPKWVMLTYAEYQRLNPEQPTSMLDATPNPAFEREYAAFQRLLPDLLTEHRGEWVAIVDEQPVLFGTDFASVIVPVRQQYGMRAVCVQEIIDPPRVYHLRSPQVVRA